MIQFILRALGRKKEPRYSCYFVAIHFGSAEEAAAFLNQRGPHVLTNNVRLLRGGETIPLCLRPEEEV